MSATLPDQPHESPPKINDPPIEPERLAVLDGHEKYLRMRDRIVREPLDLIREMKHGGYRFKCRRGMPGVFVRDRDHNRVPERMSFRQIAPILTEMSGVEVTYETVRRWWEAVFPDEADEPDEFEAETTPAPVAPRPRRRTPAAIQDAMNRAQAPTTNPDVPPAAFLPPTAE